MHPPNQYNISLYILLRYHDTSSIKARKVLTKLHAIDNDSNSSYVNVLTLVPARGVTHKKQEKEIRET
jgi:hypothetical protein